MKRFLASIALMVSVNSAYASCDKIDQIHGLTAEVRQEMKVQCETKKLELTQQVNNSTTNENSVASAITNPDVLTEWGAVAQEFAKALGIAARELGIASNEFLQTPAGMLTATLIVWHVAGTQLLGAVIGIPLLIFWLWACLRIWRKIMIKGVEYETVKTWYGGTKRVVANITYTDDSEDRTWALVWVAVMAMAGAAANLGWIIF